MFNQIRKNQRWLLIFISGIVIIAFAWLYNQYDYGSRAQALKVGDKSYTPNEMQQLSRLFTAAQALGLEEFYTVLFGVDRRDQDLIDFVINLTLLRHHAQRLGIEPTEEQIVAELRALPVFQTNGSYDPAKAEKMLQETFAPLGMSNGQMSDVIRDKLRFDGVRELLGSGIRPAPREVAANFERFYSTIEASYVTFATGEYLASSTVTLDEIKKHFKENGEQYQSPELRSVHYVVVEMKAAQAPDKEAGDGEEQEAPAKPKLAPLQEAANLTSDIYDQLLQGTSDLKSAAKQNGLKLRRSKPFERNSPPADLPGGGALAERLFALTAEEPYGEPVRLPNGFVLFELGKVVAPEPLSFSEAAEQIRQELRSRKASEKLDAAVAEARTEISEALASGREFANFAAERDWELITMPPFSPNSPPRGEVANMLIAYRITDLAQGELSEPIDAIQGKALAYVDRRFLDEEAADFPEKKARFEENFTRREQFEAFRAWLSEQREAAGIARNLNQTTS